MDDREALAKAMRNGAGALRSTARRSENEGYPDDAAFDIEQAIVLEEAAALLTPAALLEPQPSTPKCYYPKCWRNATTNRRGYPICDEHREVQLAIEAYEGREPTAQERARTEQAIANAEKRPEPQPSLSVSEAAKKIVHELAPWDGMEKSQAEQAEERCERIVASIISRVAEPQGAPDPVPMLVEDNRRLKLAGDDLAVAALRVTTEYDGVHRLRLAVAAWSKAVADEGGRGERYRAAAPSEGTGELRELVRDFLAAEDAVDREAERAGGTPGWSSGPVVRRCRAVEELRAALRTPAAPREATEPDGFPPYDEPEGWKCPRCGTHNLAGVEFCCAPAVEPSLVERLKQAGEDVLRDDDDRRETAALLCEAAAALAASAEREKRVTEVIYSYPPPSIAGGEADVDWSKRRATEDT